MPPSTPDFPRGPTAEPIRRSAMRSPRRSALIALALIALGCLVLVLARRGPRAPSEDALLRGAAPVASRLSSTPRTSPAEPPPRAPSEAASNEPTDNPRELWGKRLDRAQETLATYLAANRYPPMSRPMSEQPDTARPHFVADETARLKRRDGKLTDARARLHQDRYFLVGDERVALSLTCENSDGPAPCEVLATKTRAEIGGADGGPAEGPAGAQVTFTRGQGDNGNAALVASFQPSTQGFSGYHGPIRVFIDLRIDSEEGEVSFEVMFTPRAPAVFTGAFREAIVKGSLEIAVEINVEVPGRYVITARADDAAGKPTAMLTFNDELGRGKQTAKLTLFGKLIGDEGARAPFRVHDVEGFLLKEDAFPDRELMQTLEGVAYTTGAYPEDAFSDAVWDSPDKQRHLDELTRRVEEAKEKAASAP